MESEIFPKDKEPREDMGVRILGKMPLDPRLARCCDIGEDPLTEMKDSPAVNALFSIIDSMYYEIIFLHLLTDCLKKKIR